MDGYWGLGSMGSGLVGSGFLWVVDLAADLTMIPSRSRSIIRDAMAPQIAAQKSPQESFTAQGGGYPG